MRRISILAAYTVVFWIAVPCVLWRAAAFADKRIGIAFSGSPWMISTGAFLTAASAALLFLSVVQFRRFAGEWPVSAFPCDRLIQRGLYAAWRHPIYLFYTLTLIGIGLVVHSAGLLLVTAPAFAVLTAVYSFLEERVLVRRYGKKYENYRRKTGLFVPRFPHWLRAPAWIFFKVAFRYRILHAERIPADPPFFVASAHRCYLDPFFIAEAVPFPLSFITTFEMFRNPASAWLFRKLLCIPRKRYAGDADSLRRTLRAIDADYAIGVFPEGERSWTGGSGILKPEALRLLWKCGDVPILPVRVEGNYPAWPRWSVRFRRAPVRIVFENPIRADSRTSLQQFEKDLAAVLRPDDRGTGCSSGSRARGLDWVIYRCPSCRRFESLHLISGIHLQCRSCGIRITLTPDCTLQFSGGTERSIPDVYQGIKITRDDLVQHDGALGGGMDLDVFPFEACIARSDRCVFYREKGRAFHEIGPGILSLTNRRLVWTGNPGVMEIALSDITSVTVESNRKLQVFSRPMNTLHQATFVHESVLKWQDWLSEAVGAFTGHIPNRT